MVPSNIRLVWTTLHHYIGTSPVDLPSLHEYSSRLLAATEDVEAAIRLQKHTLMTIAIRQRKTIL